MEFANKEYLFLLLLLIPYMVWYLLYKKNAEPSLRMSDTFAYQYAHRSWRVRMIHVPFALRVITFIMLILVLARPHQFRKREAPPPYPSSNRDCPYRKQK